MKMTLRILCIIALVAFSTWLVYRKEAAQPGLLRAVHEENATCGDCHVPWRGVSNKACLECHSFHDTSGLRTKIRFHETESLCLSCHTEHRGVVGRVSKMDHTLLNPELQCSTCHFDPHKKLFGESCRECHGIYRWDVPGYRHPLAERENCVRCHRPPLSHQDQSFWKRLEVRHQIKIGSDENVKPQECWKCHVPHSWEHLRM
jgi:hypothetical protein